MTDIEGNSSLGRSFGRGAQGPDSGVVMGVVAVAVLRN